MQQVAIVYKVLAAGLMLWVSASAQAVLKVEITKGAVGALPVAVVPFAGDDLGVDVAAIIESDLTLTGRFVGIERRNMLERPSSSAQVDYPNWRLVKADFLVVGSVAQTATGKVYQFELIDVFKRERLLAYNIPVAPGQERGGAHYISDLVYEKITGERGAFNTNIAYVSLQRTSTGAQYVLNVSDIDGANPKPVVRSTEPLMSPSWSPDGSQLAYVTFEQRRSSIYIQNLATGQRTLVSREDGINGAPVFSPDGNRLAYTLSSGGNIDIWIKNLRSGSRQRLTKNVGIDTEPAFSPDGRYLAFTSNRGGSAQIYEYDLRTNRIERLTFKGKENLRARYSPDGKKLAVVTNERGSYKIAVFDKSNGSQLTLTEGALDESPSFSPNGAIIVYAMQRGSRAELAAVSVDGQVHQRFTDQRGEIREPVWSPFVE